ncbi:patatin family protein [Ruminococcaceae bacterium OttesenSCG-928-O06]|nr:patatin family protein [Ruminococcaceae bacterium OttesenSCG-928-O06]
MKTAIVCEGGGMRGVYTSGVLQAFMEGGFVADELVGVSAGASNGASYVSGQKGRGYRTNVDYAADPRYCSVGNFLKTGSIFGMDYIFTEIADVLDPFDFEAFHAAPCGFWAGATDVATGKATFFGKDHISQGLMAIRASCSLPMLSHMVEIDGRLYLDGGIADPIPIDKALADGCERLVVVLTRERGYRKTPQSFRPVYRQMYRQWPAFVQAMQLRHLTYNHTLERLWRLEEAGQAIVIAPAAPLGVDRFGKDKEKLVNAYYTGLADGQQALTLLR